MRLLSSISALLLLGFVSVSAQTPSVVYDVPELGGFVFPGTDGRLTADDAQLTGQNLILDSLTLPVAASGTGAVDVTAYVFEDSGAGPGSLLWQATLPGQSFDSAPGVGDFQSFTWNTINTPIPNDIYWGVRFSNPVGNLAIVGSRAGDISQATPDGASSDPNILYVSTDGDPNGSFSQFDFVVGANDLEDNLAVSIQAVPEPRVLGLLLFGAAGIWLLRRRKTA